MRKGRWRSNYISQSTTKTLIIITNNLPKNEVFVERRPNNGDNILLGRAHTLEHQFGIFQIFHSHRQVIYKQLALNMIAISVFKHIHLLQQSTV